MPPLDDYTCSHFLQPTRQLLIFHPHPAVKAMTSPSSYSPTSALSPASGTPVFSSLQYTVNPMASPISRPASSSVVNTPPATVIHHGAPGSVGRAAKTMPSPSSIAAAAAASASAA